uniref:DNA-directed RNA polymerase n=1 Tax=viral metagenome TaxID=1070528 RepID=A0A6C0D5V4_9ZZZZ
MDNSTIWKIIDKYFEDNPQALVRHHIESYNDFFKNGIYQIFKDKNPVRIERLYDNNINDYRTKCLMYFGGKDGTKIYFGKPIIYDDNNSHYMYPNEARLRNMTYGMTIHYDVEIEFIDVLEKGEMPYLVEQEGEIEGGGSESDEDEGGDTEFKNFKLKSKEDYAQEDAASKKISGGYDENENEKEEIEGLTKISGGAPKDAAQKQRGRRKKIPAEMTTAQTALLREVTEESMIAPNVQKRTRIIEKVFLGKFPIMVQSDFCVLHGLPKEVRHTMGECMNDVGGYFIIDGKEKTVISQEKFGDNMLYIKESTDETYLYSAEIRSVSENVAKPIRTLSVKIVAPTPKYTFKNIVVNIPNVRKPVPLFIVFRALGIISDKQIITMCLLDLDKYENMIDLFEPSVHDAGGILTQQNALRFIATLTKGKTVSHTLEILSDYFFPHIGEMNFTQKAYYLGYVVFRLLNVFIGIEPPTDRDNYKFKRVELIGSLLTDLFREYYTIQQRLIHLTLEEQITYEKGLYENNLYGLIDQNFGIAFAERSVEMGFKKAFKGNWGAQTHTKRVGIVQDLNRLSHNSMLSHLRKINLPLDASVKLVGPRALHSTQWGLFDPIDTPDGGNIGIHKHLSISAYVSQGTPRQPMINWLREKLNMKLIEECTPIILSRMTKVIINGLWTGVLDDPIRACDKIRLFRRNGLLPIYHSVTFDTKQNTIYIYTDAGRVCRPLFYRDPETGRMSFDSDIMKTFLAEDDFTWTKLISGFNPKKIEGFHPNQYKMYELSELYDGISEAAEPSTLAKFLEYKAIIDYVDTNETENALIALNPEDLDKNILKKPTHMEIHESFIFGMMCNLINFPENNPATRNSFSCGQSKQACSLYHTNHQVRMDKTAVVLVSGQNPLVKTRYLEHINNESNPYGENAIVAIMCYTGYNVEDAVLINEGALKRGLFRTTYYTTYEAHEEKDKSGDVTVNKVFANIENESNVVGLKPGHDYSKLDKYGIIKEGTEINDKTILIGLTASSSANPDQKLDMSKTTKKGQLGIVDKTFITEGEEGKRIAKVRIREERVPNLGDKMACALPTQQVLTHLGWVEIKDIDISLHKVATLDKNGNMCYEHPVNKFEYEHSGKMYYVKNKQVHVICTLNHKLYVKGRGKKDYQFIEAEHVMGKTVRFNKSMKNMNPDIEFMVLGEKKYKMDDWLQLLGMFIADGSTNNRAAVLSAHKQRKVNFNIDILTKLGIEYYHDSFNGYFAINIGKYREIYNELKKHSVGALNKSLPEYVWNLSQRQSIILLEALMEGDGHTYADGFSRYGTISMKLANDVSRLAVHCGWSGIIKIAEEPSDKLHICTGTMGYGKGKSHEIMHKNRYYKISIIRKQNEPYINKKINDSNEEKLIDYEGKVYCIEMPSSHLYYMRETDFTASMLIGNSRAGQKGTVGLVIPEQDMPFTKEGIRPDIIVNPHALPTRMTIGHLVECIIGKASACHGGYADSTAFNNKGSKVKVFGEILSNVGFHSSGNEILYNGMTGQQIEAEIFMGPNYYMRLKHMVKDKINYRSLGPRTALTKQPVAGRANDGGLRIGEMERDAVISHGLTDFLRESMMERGDKYQMAVCNTTGLIAIYNPAKNLFMSPMADGPLRFTASLDGKHMNIDNVSRFGRNFSVVNVPYSLKLLLQELETINIQMRIITEDNIQQLENMSYSRNIETLLFDKDATPAKITAMIKQEIAKGMAKEDVYRTPESLRTPFKTPETEPGSPAYVPGPDELGQESNDSSPAYTARSPVYLPTTPDGTPPNFLPTTPDETPPANFLPTTPDGTPPSLNDLSDQALLYKTDDLVHYRGDVLPERLWKITNVGDRVLTIEATTKEGLEPGDTTKIVTPIDIYKPEDFAYTSPFAETLPGQTGLYNTLDQTNYPVAPQLQPLLGGGYNVQPVVPAINIKVVGGSDFSTGQDGGQNMNQTSDIVTTANQNQNIQSGGDTNPISDSGKLDFSRLQIKKLG